MNKGATNDIKLSGTPIQATKRQAHRKAQVFLVSPHRTQQLSQREPASAGTSRGSFRVQENDKGNALCLSCRSACCGSSTRLHHEQKLQYRQNFDTHAPPPDVSCICTASRILIHLHRLQTCNASAPPPYTCTVSRILINLRRLQNFDTCAPPPEIFLFPPSPTGFNCVSFTASAKDQYVCRCTNSVASMCSAI